MSSDNGNGAHPVETLCRMLFGLTGTVRAAAQWSGMQDRRIEPRMMCADLIEVSWKDKSGLRRVALANLEDISLSGACLQMEAPVPRDTRVRIAHPKAELEGRVRYCVFRETGYFLGVQFEPGCKWSRRAFRPKHLLDPRRLVAISIKRAMEKDKRG